MSSAAVLSRKHELQQLKAWICSKLPASNAPGSQSIRHFLRKAHVHVDESLISAVQARLLFEGCEADLLLPFLHVSERLVWV